MNKLLASLMGVLNGFLALFFIAGGASLGVYLGQLADNGALGLILGLVGGLFLAVMVCGVFAVFISIRSELIAIRSFLATRS